MISLRSHVAIVQIRVSEIQGGDVVNKRGPERSGWIEVDKIEQLAVGSFVIHDIDDEDSFTADFYDLVWLQTIVPLQANSHIALPQS